MTVRRRGVKSQTKLTFGRFRLLLKTCFLICHKPFIPLLAASLYPVRRGGDCRVGWWLALFRVPTRRGRRGRRNFRNRWFLTFRPVIVLVNFRTCIRRRRRRMKLVVIGRESRLSRGVINLFRVLPLTRCRGRDQKSRRFMIWSRPGQIPIVTPSLAWFRLIRRVSKIVPLVPARFFMKVCLAQSSCWNRFVTVRVLMIPSQILTFPRVVIILSMRLTYWVVTLKTFPVRGRFRLIRVTRVRFILTSGRLTVVRKIRFPVWRWRCNRGWGVPLLVTVLFTVFPGLIARLVTKVRRIPVITGVV